MLKGVDPRISPDALRDLAATGHLETILIADGNFPVGRLSCPVHHLGADSLAVLEAVLSLVPLETAGDDAASIRVDDPEAPLDELHSAALRVVRAAEPEVRDFARPALPDFVVRATGASVAVITTDAQPACFVLTRGVVR